MISNALPKTQLFRIAAGASQARVRLFCFPYAGGAASIFRAWHQHLPAEIQVCAMQLPGRENRLQEQPRTSAAALVGEMLPDLLPYLDMPYAIFGHSMGALLAYELAQQLNQRQVRMPEYLFVSGHRAPMLPRRNPPLHSIASDQEFLAGIQQRYNNLPAVLFDDAELRSIFVPLLRADLTIAETYVSSCSQRLPCPIVALGGVADPHVTPAELQAWQELAQGSFGRHLFPGDHFYLNRQPSTLFDTIAKYLLTV